jgi:hypothetical protein
VAEIETPLAGGNINTGVVRVGNTVRRSQTPASATIHQLLLHLQAKGFGGSPRFLGVDDEGREILSFVAGSTGIPSYIWQQDAPLIAAARLLRQYHDATLDFVPPVPAAWAYRYPDARRHEVVCHNDFAPYNFVYGSGGGEIPIAIIDFDLVGPGPRLRDVAYAAYWMTPLSLNSGDQKDFAAADLAAGSRRLKLFCAVYGIRADAALLNMIEEVLAYMGDERQMLQVVGEAAASRLKADGHLAHWQREAAAFRQQRRQQEANLGHA